MHSRFVLLALAFTASLYTPTLTAANSGTVAIPAELAAYDNPTGLDTSGISKDIRAQDDFYAHMNQQWIEQTTIPADRSYWSIVSQLRDINEQRQRDIIEEMAARHDAPQGSAEHLVGAFFASLTESRHVDGMGVKPIAELLLAIDAIESASDLAAFFGRISGDFGDAPIGLGTLPDPGEDDKVIAYLWQSGLALPGRDYYLEDDPKFAEIRAAYPAYIAQLLTLAGYRRDEASAANVMVIERHLAEGHWAPEDTRDWTRMYNMVSTRMLPERAPGFDWDAFLAGAGVPDIDAVNASQPDYVEALGALVAQYSIAEWQDYLRFQVLNSSATWLDQTFDDAHFAFMRQRVYGIEQAPEDWKKAVRIINDLIGEAVGQIYVRRYFPPAYKARMVELVDNLLEEFRVGITQLSWMSDETKARAEQKRQALSVKIGYPDQWRDYSALRVTKEDPVGNLRRAMQFQHQYELSKIGLPVDRNEWHMTPQTVNAYHNPFTNEIVFPAGYLQPPNFNMAADDAANYGVIGMTIGHEIGHAFDDAGRRFGPDGNLTDWWTADDAQRFEEAAAKLVDQYNAFEPLTGLHVNGELTLGENIADLTGVTLAYRAYHSSLGGKPAPVIDGLTGDQRFFMAFAQGERTTYRDEILRVLVTSDPHSPGEYRVNGVLPHLNAFVDAFGVKAGDGMYREPADRVSIW